MRLKVHSHPWDTDYYLNQKSSSFVSRFISHAFPKNGAFVLEWLNANSPESKLITENDDDHKEMIYFVSFPDDETAILFKLACL